MISSTEARRRLSARIGSNNASSLAFISLVTALAALMVVPLLLILGFVAMKGIPQMSLAILLKDERNGGILNALVGSAFTSGIAILAAAPLGVLCGIWLSEARKGGVADAVRASVDIISGLPSIIVGIIAYLWLVVPFKRFSAIAGSAALAVMMLPLIIKSTEESLRLVPAQLKEGAYALGAPRYKVLLGIVLPAASGGVVSGILLSLARSLGETAPLLFTAFGYRDMQWNPLMPMEALPPLIYKYATSPTQELIDRAWAAAFVLVAAVLAINLATRAFTGKRRES